MAYTYCVVTETSERLGTKLEDRGCAGAGWWSGVSLGLGQLAEIVRWRGWQVRLVVVLVLDIRYTGTCPGSNGYLKS